MCRGVLTFLALLGIHQCVSAQFLPLLLQNRSYWGDGKSEIDFYDGEFVRGGQHLHSEILFILTPGFIDPLTLAPLEQKRATECQPVIRMKHATAFARGLWLEQQSAEALWQLDPVSLVRLSFVGTDGKGNIARIVRPKRDSTGVTWQLIDQSYQGRTEQPPVAAPSGAFIFYDELPVRVRMIDFSKAKGEIEVQLASSIADASAPQVEFKPAKITFEVGERQVQIELQHANGTDYFTLDSNFPFLLREWKMATGEIWKMKNSLRADYQKYDRPGDRERALKDPMLRHPD